MRRHAGKIRIVPAVWETSGHARATLGKSRPGSPPLTRMPLKRLSTVGADHLGPGALRGGNRDAIAVIRPRQETATPPSGPASGATRDRSLLWGTLRLHECRIPQTRLELTVCTPRSGLTSSLI